MNNRVDIPDWYQFDIVIKEGARATLSKITKIIDEFKSQNLIKKWFYLYENPKGTATFRIRLKSTDKKKLERILNELILQYNLNIFDEWPFQTYWEDTNTFSNLEMLEAFANIMSEVSQLNIKRFQGQIGFSCYTLVERFSHCIFNNTYGTNTEGYFLLKRLEVNFNNEDNPEQTLLDDKISWKTLQSGTLNLSGIKIPTRHEEK